MGKRELLIAAVFIVLGFGVYRLSAPPADPSSRGFSIGPIVDEIRREIRGRPAYAETTFTARREIPEAVGEIRLDFQIGTVTVVGTVAAEGWLLKSWTVTGSGSGYARNTVPCAEAPPQTELGSADTMVTIDVRRR